MSGHRQIGPLSPGMDCNLPGRFDRLMDMYQRVATSAVVAVCLVAVAACGSDRGESGTGGLLTDTQRRLALHAAHLRSIQYAMKPPTPRAPWPSNITMVTGRPGHGPVHTPNTRYLCTSRTVLTVDLLGRFPIAVSPPAGGGSSTAVHAVELKVDGVTGKVCSVSVGTGRIKADPRAEVLYRR